MLPAQPVRGLAAVAMGILVCGVSYPPTPGQESLWKGASPIQGCLLGVVVQEPLWRTACWGGICSASKVDVTASVNSLQVSGCLGWGRAGKTVPVSTFVPGGICRWRTSGPHLKISQHFSHIS